MNFTPLIKGHFRSRLQEQLAYIDHPGAVQQGQLVRLIETAALTEFGRKYDFSSIRTYEDFAHRVPLHRYEDLRPMIMRMMRREASVLWPGQTLNYAQSSGTSDGKSKYIPITRQALRGNHYKGASDVVAHYLNLNPDSKLFAGKAFILGGSFANELKPEPGVSVGDLSATLIQNINPLANLFRVPDKQVALMADWSEKLPALVKASIGQNITNLSGVPSWFLTVLKSVLKHTGRTCIHDVWPNLEVFFHGGIAFRPYRRQYEAICDMSKMHFLDTYNASEGFFAVQTDWEDEAMMLLLDIGVFYEFIPVEQTDSDRPDVVPLWEVDPGHTYELIITACNGLWRYRIGDTVTVTQRAPVKVRIAGRTKSFINAFGEEVMVHNADEAITAAAQQSGAQVTDYTVAPVYADTNRSGHHQWLVEFAVIPDNPKEFITLVDKRLQEVNSDYQAKRSANIFLTPPTLVMAPTGLFDRWLESTGKRGGQRKIPRLCNDRELMDKLLEIMQQMRQ